MWRAVNTHLLTKNSKKELTVCETASYVHIVTEYTSSLCFKFEGHRFHSFYLLILRKTLSELSYTREEKLAKQEWTQLIQLREVWSKQAAVKMNLGTGGWEPALSYGKPTAWILLFHLHSQPLATSCREEMADQMPAYEHRKEFVLSHILVLESLQRSQCAVESEDLQSKASCKMQVDDSVRIKVQGTQKYRSYLKQLQKPYLNTILQCWCITYWHPFYSAWVG